jgi:hypothetical protein
MASSRFGRQRKIVTELAKETDAHSLTEAVWAKENLLERTRRERPELLAEMEEEDREREREREKIARWRRAQEGASESSPPVSEGVKETAYYKAQYEKYYNIYMGNASQKSDKSANDTLLDDWAHAKDSGVFDDTNW